MDSLKNRILKEFEDLKKNEKENSVIVWMVDENIRHWKGKIKGPVIISNINIITVTFQIDTCYTGGEFIIDIIIIDDYPFKPPKVLIFLI